MFYSESSLQWKKQLEKFLTEAIGPRDEEQARLSIIHEPGENSKLLKREEKVKLDNPRKPSDLYKENNSAVSRYAVHNEEVIVPTVSSVEGSSTTFSGEEIPVLSPEVTPVNSVKTDNEDPPLGPPVETNMDNKEDEEEFMPAEPSTEIENKEEPLFDEEKVMTSENFDVIPKTDELDINVNESKDFGEKMEVIGELQDDPTLSLAENSQISMEKPKYDSDEAASSTSVLPAVLIIIGVIVGVVLFAAVVSLVLKSSMISGISGSGLPNLPLPVPQEQAPLNDVQAQRVAQMDW